MYEPYYNNYYPYMNQPYMRQSQFNNRTTLQGKTVDSIEVVKAADIPLDGSISYFPLMDGSGIVTKQLQQDGTSKVIVYKPVAESGEAKPEMKFVTEEEFKEQLKGINSKDIKDIKEDIKILKRKLEDIKDDIKEK